MATKKKASAKPAKKKTASKPKPRKPRPQSLPGMEDRAISALETLALNYADVRDERIANLVEEKKLKQDLLDEMKRQKRETYKHGRIEINIVHESENVKVKIHKEDSDDELSHDDAEVEIEEEVLA